MRIRIKWKEDGTRCNVLETPGTDAEATLLCLKQQIARDFGLSSSSVRLSLNRKDCLENSYKDCALLQEIGIVSGDTIWVMESSGIEQGQPGPSTSTGLGGTDEGNGRSRHWSGSGSERDKSDELGSLFQCANPSTGPDYVMASVHYAMTERCFYCEGLPATSTLLPEDWKATAVHGFYRLAYRHPHAGTRVEMNAMVMGQGTPAVTLVLNASVEVGDQPKLQTFHIKISDFVKDGADHSGSAPQAPKDVFHDLPAALKYLSDVVDSIADDAIGSSCMLIRAITTVGANGPPHRSFKYRMLKNASIRTILRLERTSTQLYGAIHDDAELWRMLLVRDFGDDGLAKSHELFNGVHRVAYADLYQAQKRELEERLRRENEMDIRHPIGPFFVDPNSGRHGVPLPDPGEFPGMIGGRSDLDPFGGQGPFARPRMPPGIGPPDGLPSPWPPGPLFEPRGPRPGQPRIFPRAFPDDPPRRGPRPNPRNPFGGGPGFPGFL